MGDTSLRRASGVLARVRKSGSTLPGRRIPAAMLSLWTSSPRWVVLFMAGPPYVARAAGLSRDQSTNPCGRGRPLESVHMMTRRSLARIRAPGGTRTHTVSILSALPLPVGIRGPRLLMFSEQGPREVMLGRVGLGEAAVAK